jgi:hypothetical protein
MAMLGLIAGASIFIGLLFRVVGAPLILPLQKFYWF